MPPADHPPTDPAAEPGPEPFDPGLDHRLAAAVRSLRLQLAAAVAAAFLAVLAMGPLLLFASPVTALVLAPLLVVVSFAAGFLAAGRVLALSLARHHRRLRADLDSRREETRAALVGRWLSLAPAERFLLRARFPDIDWNAIDRMAGTDGDAQPRH